MGGREVTSVSMDSTCNCSGSKSYRIVTKIGQGKHYYYIYIIIKNYITKVPAMQCSQLARKSNKKGSHNLRPLRDATLDAGFFPALTTHTHTPTHTRTREQLVSVGVVSHHQRTRE